MGGGLLGERVRDENKCINIKQYRDRAESEIGEG